MPMRLILRTGAVLAALVVAGCVTAPSHTPGTQFRDCRNCPEMAIIPPGTFVMGSPESEAGRFDDEGPAHQVTIARPIAVMRKPVTVAEFRRFADQTAFTASGPCNHWNAEGNWEASPRLDWRDPGFEQTGSDPVVCISWRDAQLYAEWVSAKAGHRYRLLSEAEFEYATRAGSMAAYPWGQSGEIFCRYANGFDRTAGRLHPDWGDQSCDDGYPFTSPVGSFPPNGFGLLDMTGNAFQWVEDCFVDGGYRAAPSDGSAVAPTRCKARVIRGGSWTNGPRGLRSAMRDRDPEDSRYSNITIRLARDLD